jgi:hypothetical protein
VQALRVIPMQTALRMALEMTTTTTAATTTMMMMTTLTTTMMMTMPRLRFTQRYQERARGTAQRERSEWMRMSRERHALLRQCAAAIVTSPSSCAVSKVARQRIVSAAHCALCLVESGRYRKWPRHYACAEVFKIAAAGRHIAQLTLSSSVLRPGEVLHGCFDFSDSQAACLQVRTGERVHGSRLYRALSLCLSLCL